jgi:hypothetical protein
MSIPCTQYQIAVIIVRDSEEEVPFFFRRLGGQSLGFLFICLFVLQPRLKTSWHLPYLDFLKRAPVCR